MREILRTVSSLVQKELELARAEARADVRDGIAMVIWLGVAALAGLLALNLFLVAGVLALAESGLLAGWLAAVLVGGVLVLVGTIAGIVGWSRRLTSPLARTRATLMEGIRWAKRRAS